MGSLLAVERLAGGDEGAKVGLTAGLAGSLGEPIVNGVAQ